MYALVLALLAAAPAGAATLPAGEDVAAWAEAWRHAGLDSTALVGVEIVVSDGGWSVSVPGADGTRRSVRVAAPRTQAEREDVAGLVSSLRRAASVGMPTFPPLPPAAKPAAPAAAPLPPAAKPAAPASAPLPPAAKPAAPAAAPLPPAKPAPPPPPAPAPAAPASPPLAPLSTSTPLPVASLPAPPDVVVTVAARSAPASPSTPAPASPSTPASPYAPAPPSTPAPAPPSTPAPATPAVSPAPLAASPAPPAELALPAAPPPAPAPPAPRLELEPWARVEASAQVWPGRELGARAAIAGGIATGAWRLGVEGGGTAPAEIVALGGNRTQAEAGIGLRVGWAPGGAIPGIELGPTWVHTWFDEAGAAVADEGFPTVDLGVRWEVPVGPVALVVGAAGAYALAPTVVRIGADGADVALSPLRARLAAGVAWPR